MPTPMIDEDIPPIGRQRRAHLTMPRIVHAARTISSRIGIKAGDAARRFDFRSGRARTCSATFAVPARKILMHDEIRRPHDCRPMPTARWLCAFAHDRRRAAEPNKTSAGPASANTTGRSLYSTGQIWTHAIIKAVAQLIIARLIMRAGRHAREMILIIMQRDARATRLLTTRPAAMMPKAHTEDDTNALYLMLLTRSHI